MVDISGNDESLSNTVSGGDRLRLSVERHGIGPYVSACGNVNNPGAKTLISTSYHMRYDASLEFGYGTDSCLP